MSDALEPIELETPRSERDGQMHFPAQQNRVTIEQSLEPADGGLAAWKFLFAAFVFEAILWGFPLSFGVFQNYYFGLPQFQDDPSVTYIGTIATGMVYFVAPLMVVLNRRYPHYQRQFIWLGWPLCIIGLISGSFADTIGGLIMTQGIIYGFGYGLIFYPVVSMMNEWWVVRRGFAWGIMIASSGASGMVFPFILQALLEDYGYKTTLRGLAVAMFALTGPLLPFLKGRLPATQSNTLIRADWSFIKKPLFWLYALSTLIQSLGFYLPSLYLPTYASVLGTSLSTGPLLLALMSMASVFGQLIYGVLSDSRVPLSALLLSTTVIAAVSSFTLWGLSSSKTLLLCFSLIYGFFAYAFLAMRVRMGTALSTDPAAALGTFCAFSFCQGIGNVLAGPISGSLLISTIDPHEYGYLRFKAIIIFTGSSMTVTAFIIGLSSFTSIRRM